MSNKYRLSNRDLYDHITLCYKTQKQAMDDLNVKIEENEKRIDKVLGKLAELEESMRENALINSRMGKTIDKLEIRTGHIIELLLYTKVMVEDITAKQESKWWHGLRLKLINIWK